MKLKKIIFLLRGLPGSGKTTLGELLSKTLKCDLYSADMFFERIEDGKTVYVWNERDLHHAHAWCRESVEKCMKKNKCVIVANTLVKKKDIREYTEMAAKYDYTVFSLVVENRHGHSNIHNVQDKTLEQFARSFNLQLLPEKNEKT